MLGIVHLPVNPSVMSTKSRKLGIGGPSQGGGGRKSLMSGMAIPPRNTFLLSRLLTYYAFPHRLL